MSFWASPKVAAETSGPAGGEVANAEGAPGGALLCAEADSNAPMVAPTTPREALVKKRLRDFFNVSPDFSSF